MPTRSTARMAAALACAVIAALLSAYPLLAGRSVVSPWVGSVSLLYPGPPFAPGADGAGPPAATGDRDVWATMLSVMPGLVLVREAYGTGEWPWWNRFAGIGQPLWGQGQSFAADPLSLFVVLAPDVATGWDWRTVAGRVIFATGTAVLVLALTASSGAAILVGASAPFIGLFEFRLNHPAQFAVVYAPWLLWLWVRWHESRRRRPRAAWTLAIGAATALMLVGAPPKEAVVTIAVTTMAGMLPVCWPGASRCHAWTVVVALAGAVLVTAPHWLVFLETLGQSFTIYDRAGVSIAPWNQAAGLWLGPFKPGTQFPGLNPLLSALVGVAIVSRATWRSPATAAIVLAAGGALAVAFGVVPDAILLDVPFLGRIFWVGIVFTTAALPVLLPLAGVGAARLLEADDGRRARVAWTAMTVVAAVAVGALSPASWRARVTGAALAATAVGLAAVLGAPSVRGPRARALLLGAAAWLLAVPGGLHTPTGIPKVDAALVTLPPRVRLEQPLDLAGASPERAVGVDGVLAPGSQVYYGIESLGFNDALEWRDFRALMDAAAAYATPVTWDRRFDAADVPRLSGLLDMLNVGRVLYPAAAPGALRVVARPSAWPRAFAVPSARTHGSLDELARAIATGEGPFASVDASDVEARRAVADLPAAGWAPIAATEYRFDANGTTMTVVTPGAALLVVSEMFVDGAMEATVNGAAAGVVRVNHVARGVRLPEAGRWRVRVGYHPASWSTAGRLAAVGAVAWALLAAVGIAGWGDRRIGGTNPPITNPPITNHQSPITRSFPRIPRSLNRPILQAWRRA